MPRQGYLIRPENIPERAACPVVDLHNHFSGNWENLDDVVRIMDDVGVACYCDLTANTKVTWEEGGYVVRQGSFDGFMANCARRFPGRFIGFTTAGFAVPPHEPLFNDASEFADLSIEILRRHVSQGAMGLKILKDLGLVWRDSQGSLVNADDTRLSPIWDEAARLDVPVLIHQADPVGFFDPPTPDNEQYKILREYPAWSFADRARYPRHDELLARLENLISRHRRTTFLVAHGANCPEDLARLARMLDDNSNIFVDFSARLDELGRQPYSAREFMIRYAGRIYFGTDMPSSRELYRFHFRFFETFDEWFAPPRPDGSFRDPRWLIHGIGLPPEVLDQLYLRNAERILNKCLT
ncbi:MAG: amidohydrolase family protein [bacterium]